MRFGEAEREVLRQLVDDGACLAVCGSSDETGSESALLAD
jgi:hypothetical protein